MSVMNSIVCDECEEDLGVGQGEVIIFYSYETEEAVRAFLEKHKGHKLRYTDENDETIEDYSLV